MSPERTTPPRLSAWVLHAECGGCGGCGEEAVELFAGRREAGANGLRLVENPRLADLVLVTGCLTRRSAPSLQELWTQTPAPKACVVAGACGCSGGVFHDGPHVAGPAADALRSVDPEAKIVFVPGCPPRPEALLRGLLKARDLLLKRDTPAGS